MSLKRKMISDLYCVKFEEEHKRKYIFVGYRDQPAAARLASQPETAEEIVGVAVKAWKLDSHKSEHGWAQSLSGLSSQFVRILSAVGGFKKPERKEVRFRDLPPETQQEWKDAILAKNQKVRFKINLLDDAAVREVYADGASDCRVTYRGDWLKHLEELKK